jgi:hypothetical protein
VKYQTLITALVLVISGCSPTMDSYTHTLYRSSMTDEGMRIHVATFDSTDGDIYNQENCSQAQKLFQGQPGVKTRFWCEKGLFKK